MTTSLSLKVDAAVKEEAMKLSKQLGIPLGTLLNAFLRQFIAEKKVTFFITENSFTPTITLSHQLQEIDTDRKTKKNFTKKMTTSNALHFLKNRA